MIKPINNLKNPDQAKILRTPTEPVIGMPDYVVDLINDLAETTNSQPNCVGLASNQIWTETTPAPSVFVMKTIEGIFVAVNPQVDKVWKKEIKESEGCMSIPGLKKYVRRPKHIQVSYYEVDGNFRTGIHFFEDIARVFMHEMDHLQGILIEDK